MEQNGIATDSDIIPGEHNPRIIKRKTITDRNFFYLKKKKTSGKENKTIFSAMKTKLEGRKGQIKTIIRKLESKNKTLLS